MNVCTRRENWSATSKILFFKLATSNIPVHVRVLPIMIFDTLKDARNLADFPIWQISQERDRLPELEFRDWWVTWTEEAVAADKGTTSELRQLFVWSGGNRHTVRLLCAKVCAKVCEGVCEGCVRRLRLKAVCTPERETTGVGVSEIVG